MTVLAYNTISVPILKDTDIYVVTDTDIAYVGETLTNNHNVINFSYKRLVRKHQPVKIIEAPVRAYIPASLPPGSMYGTRDVHGAPSIAGSDGRVLYDWQESTIPMDVASYRSLPNN